MSVFWSATSVWGLINWLTTALIGYRYWSVTSDSLFTLNANNSTRWLYKMLYIVSTQMLHSGFIIVSSSNWDVLCLLYLRFKLISLKKGIREIICAQVFFPFIYKDDLQMMKAKSCFMCPAVPFSLLRNLALTSRLAGQMICVNKRQPPGTQKETALLLPSQRKISHEIFN